MIYFHFVGIHPTPRDSYLGWAESCDVRNNWPFWGPCSYDKMWQVSNYFRTFFSVFYASQIRATEPNIIYPDIATKAKTTYQMTNFTETTRKIWMKPNETETKRHKLFTISRSNSPVLRRERNLHVVKLLKLNVQPSVRQTKFKNMVNDLLCSKKSHKSEILRINLKWLCIFSFRERWPHHFSSQSASQ